MDDSTIESITRKVLDKLNTNSAVTPQSCTTNQESTAPRPLSFSIGVSARHVHLSREHVDILFGKGHELTVFKMLLQPDQYAAQEKVNIVGPKRTLYGVRVLGPARSSTQVELSMTDCFSTGIKPHVRDSGKLSGTSGAIIVGPKGMVELKEGVIVAARHLHVEPSRAQQAGLTDQQRVNVKVCGASGRELVFGNVLVRSGDAHKAEFHIDTDEANAAGIASGDVVEVLI